MTAYRVVDDHKDLDNIGTVTHDQIDSHVNTSPFVIVSGVVGNIPSSARLLSGSGISITDGGPGGNLTLTVTGGGSATPAGNDTEIQFNDGGAFGSDSNFTFNKNTNTLSVDNLSGSLTKLSDGTSYLIAGTNVAIVTGSNGSITISSTATGGGGGDGDANATYLVLSATGSLSNERVFTAGTGLQFVDGGSGGNYTLSVNDSVVATLSGSTFTGPVIFNQGLSGSLTQLSDGSSYIVAGNNITVTSASNGSIVISGQAGDITSVTAGIGLLGGGLSGDVTLDIDDSVVATVSGTTFTGPVKFNAGLSGSLTKLVDGSSYLIAGTNVTIVTGSNGSVTINSTASGTGSPGGLDTHVQFNDGGSFGGDSNFTFNKTTNTLSVDNISGSITRLVDGSSYLIAGSNVIITTGSNGSVTISAPTLSQISQMSWMETPVGDADGVNMVFTLNYNPSPTNSLMFYVNGVLQLQGLVYDYDLSGNTVIMNYSPSSGSNIAATYAYVITPPVGTYTSWMDVPTGVADGVNNIFTLANSPIPTSALMFYVNGVLQRQGATADYTVASNIVTMNYIPNSGSNIVATYPY